MPVYIIMHTCIYVGPMHVHIVHVSMLDEERSIIDINAFMLALRLQYFFNLYVCFYIHAITSQVYPYFVDLCHIFKDGPSCIVAYDL